MTRSRPTTASAFEHTLRKSSLVASTSLHDLLSFAGRVGPADLESCLGAPETNRDYVAPGCTRGLSEAA